MRNLLPRLLDVLMFGAMTRRNPFCDPEFERLFEASFDETLRRSVGAYLKREGISASRFGRTVLGDPGFVKNGLMKGRPVKLHTADRGGPQSLDRLAAILRWYLLSIICCQIEQSSSSLS